MYGFGALYTVMSSLLQIVFIFLSLTHETIRSHLSFRNDPWAYAASVLFIPHFLSQKYEFCLMLSYAAILMQVCYNVGLVYGLLNNRIINFLELFVTIKHKEPLILLVVNVIGEVAAYVTYQTIQKNNNEGKNDSTKSWLNPSLLIDKHVLLSVQLILMGLYAYLTGFDKYLFLGLLVIRLLVFLAYIPVTTPQSFLILSLIVFIYVLFYLAHLLHFACNTFVSVSGSKKG